MKEIYRSFEGLLGVGDCRSGYIIAETPKFYHVELLSAYTDEEDVKCRFRKEDVTLDQIHDAIERYGRAGLAMLKEER